jgi:hypothetical protein
MKCSRVWFAGIAASLALLMPLEQTHCVWMSLLSHPACAPQVSTSHACCASSGHAPRRPQPPSDACCIHLPPGSLRPSVSASQPVFSSSAAVVADWSGVARTTTHRVPRPALDVGSPPHLIPLGAHGLRAPPLSV